MNSDYKIPLNQLVAKKKKEIPTTQTVSSTERIFEILENMYGELALIAGRISAKKFDEPIMSGKRSFNETLKHILNIESLNYTTIYAAFLIDNPALYPFHAERDIARLGLFENLTTEDFLSTFKLERNKTINFFRNLKPEQWNRRMTEKNKNRQDTIYWRARGLAIHDYTHILILKYQLDMM